jgi:hypothetical protein
MTYTPFVFFGYEIQLPSEMDLHESIPMLYDLNGMIRSPFEIKCILSSFSQTMNEEEYARIVIGFHPERIDELIDLSRDLSSFIQDTPLLDGFEVAEDPVFHCGIEWRPEIGSESECSTSDYDSSSESDI